MVRLVTKTHNSPAKPVIPLYIAPAGFVVKTRHNLVRLIIGFYVFCSDLSSFSILRDIVGQSDAKTSVLR